MTNSTAIRAANGPADLDNATARSILKMFIRFGQLPIWLSHGVARTLVHPQKPIANAVVDAARATPEMAGEIETWRSRLALD